MKCGTAKERRLICGALLVLLLRQVCIQQEIFKFFAVRFHQNFGYVLGGGLRCIWIVKTVIQFLLFQRLGHLLPYF